MKLKKVLAVVLAMVMVLAMICGCSQGNTPQDGGDTPAPVVPSTEGGSADDGSEGKTIVTKESFEETYNITTTAEDTKVILDADFYYMNDDTFTMFALAKADRLGYVDFLGITAAGANCLVAASAYDGLSQLEAIGRTDIPLYLGNDVPLEGFKDINELMALTGRMGWQGAYSMLDKYTTDYTKVPELGLTRSPLPAPTITPQEQSACDFIIEQIHKYPGKVVILAIAGMTNIAEAILKDPTIVEDAKGIISMGGVFDIPGQDLPHGEINWWYDPKATDIVLNAGWKEITVVPHDAAVTFTRGEDVYRKYAAKNNSHVTQLLIDYLSPIYDKGEGEEDILMCWDPMVLAPLFCPEIIEREEQRKVKVETEMGMWYGSNIGWRVEDGPEDAPICNVVFRITRGKMWDFLSDLYSIKTEPTEGADAAGGAEAYEVPASCLMDLHLHLDGSISIASARELAQIEGVELPKSDEELKTMLSVSKDCKDLNEYLDKFSLPCSLIQSPESISKAVYNLCKELEAEGHIYAEIRFAPQKSCDKGMTQDEVVQAAIDGLNQSGFNAQLILCCMRSDEDNSKENLETVELTGKYLGKGVCACDLAGAEALFPNEKYAYVFEKAREIGVPFTIHSGEALGAESVKLALEYGASRIGHGVRSKEDEEVLAILKEKGVALEIAPTSNINTCIFNDYSEVPIQFFRDYGIIVTINTDNRSVSGTDVRTELQHIVDANGYTKEDVKSLLLNAASVIFADDDVKQALKDTIEAEYK
ncbi:MAG: adenosine deaminase [Parasporobacterium sp.]|nr:adenosine deaminase [Parasporobacterium sp.]